MALIIQIRFGTHEYEACPYYKRNVYKYTNSASEAATVKVTCPLDTVENSLTSDPDISQVPSTNFCPATVGLLP